MYILLMFYLHFYIRFTLLLLFTYIFMSEKNVIMGSCRSITFILNVVVVSCEQVSDHVGFIIPQPVFFEWDNVRIGA